MATIKGSTGSDNLTGTSSDDLLVASLGNDFINATAGSDTINAGYATSSSYWRYGFLDHDTVSYLNTYTNYGLASPSDLRISVDLAAGTVQKFSPANTLLGIDTLIGVDAVWGTGGNDIFLGRNAWDFEDFRGYGGDDLINGRGGYDRATYSYATAGITVNMKNGSVTGDASVGTDTLREIEMVTGSMHADTYNATGFGGSSLATVNRNSFGESFNMYSPLSGADTIIGNGMTAVDYNGVGGALTVNLSGQKTLTTVTNIVTGYAEDTGSSAFDAGNITVSGVSMVRGGHYDDTLIGGGRVNTEGSATTVSGDRSFESFRGNGGDDFINGSTGLDRAEYHVGNQSQGIEVHLASGIVTGDPLLTGTDTLRGIESITSTYLDDLYDARGFTLSSAAAPSANNGDVVVSVAAGETLASTAFNEFRAYAGNDTVIGNGATRVSFQGLLVENGSASLPSVSVSFSGSGTGTAQYGQGDGGYGTVSFSGVYGINGSIGSDEIRGGDGYQVLRGYYGNDKLYGGNGADVLHGHLGGLETAKNLSTTLSDNDFLDGGAGNDLLKGDFGNDTLQGGIGDDTMIGGTGNDLYHLDSVGDIVIEQAAGGVDTVRSSIAYALTENVENLVLTGAGAISGTGNALKNKITGNGASNVLDGGGGKDILTGGAGNDVFVFSALADMGTTSATWDVIADFVRGSDKIDLSRFDANTDSAATKESFTAFISAGASFTQAGQLKFSGGVLYGNTDADAAHEFAIQLTGVATLALADLLL